MTPYYQDESVTLYHADCRDVLPELGRFDLLLCDPPYGIGQDGGAARTRGSKKTNGPKLGWDVARVDPCIISDVLTACGVSIIWGGNYYADILPLSRGWLYWRKHMGGDFSDGELAWTSKDSVLREFDFPQRKGVVFLHPTQKPVELMRWCITLAGDVQTILDPFAGSGTTLLAAKQMGRRAVGIEREERYCAVAVKRLAQEVIQFDPPTKQGAETVDIFGGERNAGKVV